MPIVGEKTGSAVKVKRKRTPKVKARPAPRPMGQPSVGRNAAPNRRAVAATPKPKRVIGPSPDQLDRQRPAAVKKHDASVVAANVREARLKVVRSGKPIANPHPLRLSPAASAAWARKREARKATIAGRVAPVLKVLEQTTRPVHAVAGAADAAVTHKPILKAALRGVENKDKTTFSTVLKHAGVKNKAVRAIAGTALDIGLDPTTYVTGGTGSVAAKTAEKAAARASAKATSKGLTADQAKRFGERAAAQALKTGDHTKGATLKFAGKEVPGVTRATAAASKPVRAAGRKATPERARTAVRNVAADVNPDIAPAGVSRETSRKAVQATRSARARTGQGNRDAINVAHGIRARIGEANYARVVSAIERGKISSLPDELHRPAVEIRDTLRYANRQRKQAGIRGGEIKDRPQVHVPEVTADTGVSAKSVARARRVEASARRSLAHATSQVDIHQGRAEVLSRNVSGVKAEKAAARGRSKRKVRVASNAAARTERKALAKGLTPAQAKSAGSRVQAAIDKTRYTAGGHGVSQTRTAVQDAEQHLKNATTARGAAETAHEATKTARAAQHAANQRAVKINAKRAKAPESYIPHPLTDAGLEEAGRTVPDSNYAATGSGGKRSVRPTSSKSRAEDRNVPLDELHQRYPGQYRTDLHATVAERVAQGHASAAQAGLNRRLADLGKPVKKGSSIGKDEHVWHVKGSNIREVTDRAERQAIVDTGHGLGKEGNGGRFVSLPKSLVDRSLEAASGKLPGSDRGVVRGFDKTTSAFKRTALATLGFHVRNAIGDTSQAYVHQPGQKLAGNLLRAKRVTREMARQEKAARLLERPGGKSKDIGDRPVRSAVARRRRALTFSNVPDITHSVPMSSAPKRSPGLHRVGSGEYFFHSKSGEAIGRLKVDKDGSRSVFVDPAYRRQGIATRLYAAAKDDGVKITQRRHNVQTDQGDALRRAIRKQGRGTIKTGKYGHVSYEDIAHNLVNVGAARSGYTAKELRELSDSGGKQGAKILKPLKAAGATKAGMGAKRALLNREDIPRLATAIHALRQGATWEEAAQKVADVHIDYGHLTEFERKYARRIMPFYTWTARNVPIQAKAIVRNPGKFAAYEKVREEAAAVVHPDQVDPKTRDLYARLEKAGVKLPGGYAKYLSEYEQRNAGVPVSWKGHKFTVSAGLPLGDLNELPGVAGKGQAQEYFNKAMSLMNPIIKDPAEYYANVSFFFRDQIEKDGQSPYVNAPGPVANLSPKLKAELGLVRKQDHKSGKLVWMWRGKTDYLASTVPGIPNLVKQLSTPGHDRRGKGIEGKILAGLGVKAVPLDATSNAVNLAYARKSELEKEKNGLHGQANPAGGLISAENPTPRYTQLIEQIKMLSQVAYEGKAMRGDAVLPTQGGPPKVRGSSGRLKIPGASGRVKVPGGASGRVRIP